MSSGSCAVCGKAASKRCIRCASAWYCGKEHQNADWPNHRKTSCMPFKVKTSPELGAYVVASRDIKKGELIVNEEPLVIGPDHLTPVSCCIGCLSVLPYSHRCPRCQWPICSQSCAGRKDLLFHGAECEFLMTMKSAVSMQSAMLIVPLRLLLLQKNDPKKWKVVQEMGIRAMPRMNSKKSNECKYLFEETMLKPAAKNAAKFHLDYSADTVKQIFSFLDACALEVKLPYTGNLVGAGAVASTMEHSCLPNTRRVFDLTPADAKGVPFHCRIVIRAARDIQKDEHLTASFVRNLMCTWARQQSLMSYRGLYCKCERCMDPRELGTDFNTLTCTKCSGDVLPMDLTNILVTQWRCHGKCGVVYPPSYVPELYNQIMRETEAARMGGFSVSKLEELLKRLQTTFHTNHYFCIKLKTRMYWLYGTQNEFEDVLNSRMAELGLSGLGPAVDHSWSRMSDAELQRKAELCQQVLDVIGHPLFESTDGAVDGCLMQLSLAHGEIAKRKKASGEWDEERTDKALKECQEMVQRAMSIKYLQLDNATGIAPENYLRQISESVASKMHSLRET